MEAGRRPRVAIIGGGGAMGRLFARSLAPAAAELYLMDFFGLGSRPANLVLALDEIEPGLAARAIALEPPSEETDRPWHVASRKVDPRSTAAIGWLGNTDSAGFVIPSGGVLEALTLFEDLWSGSSADCEAGALVFAAPPGPGRELLARADVVLLALGYESPEAFAETLRFYLPHLRPGAVVVDLGSTKTGPMAVLEREIGPEIDVIGAHPLFGPTVEDVTGLIVAVVSPGDHRQSSPWRGWFLDQLARLRMIVTPTTAAEHDDSMAFVQALTHFALLSFAYTFVRLDRDPTDLLSFRTPVFEPLLYLAARVAYLARVSPETYRGIQAFSTRPDARLAFLGAARELLETIERATDPDATPEPGGPDPLVELFRRSGGPWAPEGRDRRERDRREHFLEMGARLVDNLNHLRQEFVAAIGEVRAVEERRSGQPPRVVVGVVDLDLLAPGKQDVASRIRLRRLNLPLGSVLGEGRPDDGARDHVIPMARARILDDRELLEWLYRTNQLVERRRLLLAVPHWFDREVLVRLLKGHAVPGDIGTGPDGGRRAIRSARSQVWDVSIEAVEGIGETRETEDETDPGPSSSLKTVSLELAIVLHPAELVEARRRIRESQGVALDREVERLGASLAEIYRTLGSPADLAERERLEGEKDRLKHERKAAFDRRATEIDRTVRETARQQVQAIADSALAWLLDHGCAPPERMKST